MMIETTIISSIELVLHGVDGALDEVRPVVGGDHLHALRERGLELLELGLHALDDVEGVLALAHHHDAADHVALTIESAMPRRISGPRVTVATSFTVTGVPLSVFRTSFSRSSIDFT